ncbi:hypothetical protein Tco_0898062 [Tanacetum coccineum]
MVKALLLDKKNQSPAPTPVKAIEESCVTCGGAHLPTKLVQPLLAMFIEIIFKNMSLKQPHLTSTKETPVIKPRFQIKFDLPVNQGQIYRPQVVQPPAYQAPAYQAPAPQTHKLLDKPPQFQTLRAPFDSLFLSLK